MKQGQIDLGGILTGVGIVCVLALEGANALGRPEPPADQATVTAIDILLEPDVTMLRHAQANNARLLKVFPKGFTLDATHRPHVTIVQRFVRTADLEKVYAAVGKVLARTNVTGMKLEAFKYYYIPSKDIGLAGIVARPTPELLKLQQDVLAAVTPFTVQTGDSTAFVTTTEDPVIDPALIEYVSTFVPKASGEHYNPHVTTGIALRGYLDQMLAEPKRGMDTNEHVREDRRVSASDPRCLGCHSWRPKSRLV